MMLGLSNGLNVLKFITSQSIPCSFFKISAAYREWPTIFECAVIVTSDPFLSILAFPIGRRKSGLSSSAVTSNSIPYIISFSKKTTGFGSLIADLKSPMQSLALYGEITLRPGQEANQAPKH